MSLNNFSGQSVLEYAAITAIVAAALLAMFSFLKLHIQGGFRESADSLGGGRQYEENVTVVTN